MITILDKPRNTGRLQGCEVAQVVDLLVGVPRFELGTPCTPCRSSLAHKRIYQLEKSLRKSSRIEARYDSIRRCSGSVAKLDSGRAAEEIAANFICSVVRATAAPQADFNGCIRPYSDVSGYKRLHPDVAGCIRLCCKPILCNENTERAKQSAFMERQRRARETLTGMQAAKGLDLRPDEKAEILRSLARLAQHGFTVNGDGNG